MNLFKKVQEQRDLKRDYMETFGTPHGKKVLAHLLATSGATHPRLSMDPQQILWNEAQRHFALSIFRFVHGSMDTLPDNMLEQLRKNEESQ